MEYYGGTDTEWKKVLYKLGKLGSSRMLYICSLLEQGPIVGPC